MDKKKQIEEIYIPFKGEKKQIYFDLEPSCQMIFSKFGYGIIDTIYDLGYRKIPENAVVLTREELKEKIDCCDVSMIHHDNDGKRYIEYERHEDFTDRLGKRIQQLKGLLKQERKETSEKFMSLRKYITKQFHRYHEIRDKAEADYKKSKDENGKMVLNNDWHRSDAIMFILEKVGIEFDEIAKEITGDKV